MTVGAPMSERDVVEIVDYAAEEAVRAGADPDNEVTWVLPLPPWTSDGEQLVIETELRRRFPKWNVYAQRITETGFVFPP